MIMNKNFRCRLFPAQCKRKEISAYSPNKTNKSQTNNLPKIIYPAHPPNTLNTYEQSGRGIENREGGKPDENKEALEKVRKSSYSVKLLLPLNSPVLMFWAVATHLMNLLAIFPCLV